LKEIRQQFGILLFVCLTLTLIANADTKENGDYNVVVRIQDSDYSKSIVTVDIHVNVNLPVGTGFVYIPLPFEESNVRKVIVEPINNNLVLFGRIPPTGRYCLCQAYLTAEPQKLILSLRSVRLPLCDSTRSETTKMLNIFFADAYKETEFLLGKFRNVQLEGVIVYADDFQDSDPRPQPSQGNVGYQVAFDPNDRLSNLTILLSGGQNQTIFYFVMGGFGLLLGFFMAPKVIKNSKTAIGGAILAILVFAVICIIFFFVLTPKQRVADTTTIVTTGSAVGLIIGILSTAIPFIFSKQSRVANHVGEIQEKPEDTGTAA
jgi:hypothetical protein